MATTDEIIELAKAVAVVEDIEAASKKLDFISAGFTGDLRHLRISVGLGRLRQAAHELRSDFAFALAEARKNS